MDSCTHAWNSHNGHNNSADIEQKNYKASIEMGYKYSLFYLHAQESARKSHYTEECALLYYENHHMKTSQKIKSKMMEIIMQSGKNRNAVASR